MFANRSEAGHVLAEQLTEYMGAPDTIVLGIPRGGVVVAAEVAHALHLPLDIAVAAKVGAPGNPEYAIGAVAPDGEVTPNPMSGFSAAQVRALAADAHEKVSRYLTQLRGAKPAVMIEGRNVILVDDGLATGLTARAAVEWLRREGAAHVVVAVPVASAQSVESLGALADRVVVVSVPESFLAVGQFYRSFHQTQDAEVTQLLAENAGARVT